MTSSQPLTPMALHDILVSHYQRKYYQNFKSHNFAITVINGHFKQDLLKL